MTETARAEVLTIHRLKEAVNGSAAAFRCRRRLQPAGGEGDKVFPPTVAGVDFSDLGPTGDVEADKKAERLIDAFGKVTSLQVPHRLADAILRDSEIDGVAFRKSDKGKALNQVSLANATPLFELCPTALVFGMWDSTGPKGGLGPKFERAVVSEIVGLGAEVGDLRRGVRRDPLEIRAAVKVKKSADKSWTIAAAEAKGRDIVAPSEVNHSSVPFPKQRDRTLNSGEAA